MELARARARAVTLAALALCACSHAQRRPSPIGDVRLLDRAPPPPRDDAKGSAGAGAGGTAGGQSAESQAEPAKFGGRRRTGPSQIPRAGQRGLDPSARGEPMSWPLPGVLISGFGARERDQHEGIDLAAPEGTPVRAAEEGTVLFAGEQRGYGNLVLLAHDGDVVTVYAHNRENLVRKGQNVARGEPIARVGHSGNATGPHLHFEVRVAARPHDPLGFLR